MKPLGLASLNGSPESGTLRDRGIDITKFRMATPLGRFYVGTLRVIRKGEGRVRDAEAKVKEAEARVREAEAMFRKAEFRHANLREAHAQGCAAAILGLLADRRIPVARRIRRQILACRDPKLLDRWVGGAILCKSAADVIGETRVSKTTEAKPVARSPGHRVRVRGSR